MVVIDHFSKWLAVAPIRNKKAETVANVLKHLILPALPRISLKLLSDNGGEFKGKEFEEVLNEFKIDHLYSTPYMPTSNGCVERMNRTVTELLKGLESSQVEWDVNVATVVTTYNNTWHSQINMSPSDCLLAKAYDLNVPFIGDEDLVVNWREGHPNFCPFKCGQKVLKRVIKIGNKLQYKLGQKFEGPFTINKVDSNKLTYELVKTSEGEINIVKAHYKQLRPFRELSRNILKYISNDHYKDENQDTGEDISSSGNEQLTEKKLILLSNFTDVSDYSVEGNIEVDSQSDVPGSSTVPMRVAGQLDLDKLPCSEKVNQLDDIAQNWHSTPKMSNEIDFDKVLVENESYLSLLAFFDRSLKQHESLLNKAICLSNSCKGKSDLRKRSTGGVELPVIEIDESTNVLECSNVVEELQMQENTVVDVINDNYVGSQVLNETEN